jgi:hypothetical protein
MSTRSRSPNISIVLLNSAVFLIILTFTIGKSAVSVPEIIAKCRREMGGTELLAAARALSMEFSEPSGLVIDIQRPNRIHKSGKSNIVFDGRQAAWLEHHRASGSSLPPPGLISESSWADFEIDLAILFPAFLDYPADYLGSEKIGTTLYHKLRVILPLGTVAIYYIDRESFLVSRLRIDSGPQEKGYEVVYSDFRTIAGLVFPFRYTTSGGVTKQLTGLRLNPRFRKGYFDIPGNLKPK